MMRHLMKDVRFLKYRKVFARFGFGERTEASDLVPNLPARKLLWRGW